MEAASEKKGLSRMWMRLKAAFKDKEITPASTSSPQTVPSKTKEEPKATPKEEQKVEATKPIEPEPEPQPQPQPETATKTIVVDVPATLEADEAPMQNDIDRRMERARALFKKYDFNVDESEWKWEESKSRPTERVQKTIRMRVKYTCHSCNTIFGHDKVCITCQHPRCTKCIRYPPKKPKVKKVEEVAPVASEEDKPEKKCACHECQTDFEIGAEECPNCNHKICEQCLKEALVAVSPPPTTKTPEKKAARPEQLTPDPAAPIAT